MPLQVGFAEVDITPPIGVWMGGYAFRPTGCVGIHDPLYARAAYFENNGKSAVIVSMDLIGLDFDIVEAVKTGIQKSLGIPPSAIMLNASHTHGGPLTKSFLGMGHRDPRYIQWLIHKLITVIEEAAERPIYESIAYGRAPVHIGVNRRVHDENGPKIGVNPDGPTMPWVDVLVVRDYRKRPSAVLFSYACHPTTLDGSNLEITADFCGYACEYIKQMTHGYVLPMFLQGCSGNINPNPRGNFGWAKAHGRALGEAVLRAIETASPLRGPYLDFGIDEARHIGLQSPPSLEVCEQTAIKWAILERGADSKGDIAHQLHAQGMRDYSLFECEAAAFGEDECFEGEFAIQRICLGSLQILGMPGEVFVQYALDFDKQAEGPVISLGCTNGIYGYVPTKADLPHGGYEVSEAHRYYGVLPFESDSEGSIRHVAYGLLGIRNPNTSPYTI